MPLSATDCQCLPLIATDGPPPSGHSVTYPAHGAGAEYARVLSELNLRLDLRLGTSTDLPSSELPAARSELPSARSELPAARWFQAGLFDLPGGYRPLLAFASRLSGGVLSYTDPIADLEPSDLDALEPRATATSTAPSRAVRAPPRTSSQPPDAIGTADAADGGSALNSARRPDAADGGSALNSARRRFAWRVSFELPASVYATVFLRELLHHPLDAAEDARRSKTVLTAKNKTPFRV